MKRSVGLGFRRRNGWSGVDVLFGLIRDGWADVPWE